MKDYNSKVIRGTAIRAEHLRIERSKTIYKAASRHEYVKDINCFVNSEGDEIIRCTFFCLEVPDEPVCDIHDEEEVAIVCHPQDLFMPEVYALRRDFPVELPHSNARPYTRPVSLCISDVSFADIRPHFNAYDFINLIRRWFSLNSIDQLHEADRPLEVFFGFDDVCCLLNIPKDANPYVRLVRKSKLTSTLEFVEKNRATHYMCWIQTETIHASNFVQLPHVMGDLQHIMASNAQSITDRLLLHLTRTVAGKAELPILLMVYVTQQDTEGKRTNKNLFAIRTECAPREVVRKKLTLNDRTFADWFCQIPIAVSTVVDMSSRMENAIRNGVETIFTKIAVIGAGTLGSALTDHLVREGIAEEIVIADFDFYLPHNISRHTIPVEKVMTSKVRSLKEVYKGIVDQKVTALEGNFLSLNEHDKERLLGDTQLVIDTSTSIAVERHLVKDSGSYRRCTAFINPKGDDLVMLMEDETRTHRLDLLEMDYYRNLIVDEHFSTHLEVAEMTRTNTFSCRAESAILSFENIRILAAILSQQVRKSYLSGHSVLSIWHVDVSEGTVEKRDMTVTAWLKFEQKDVTIYLSSAVYEEMERMHRDSADVETGGCLFGSYDRDFGVIYVYYMAPAPPDSIHHPVSFVRGFGGLTEEYERITKLTYHQVRYLGEWHSHREMPNRPSADDDKQFRIMSEEQQSQDLPFVQMIFGSNGLYVRAIF